MAAHAGASLDPSLALHLSARPRVVWTRAERRALDSCATALPTAHGDRLVLECGKVTCPDVRGSISRPTLARPAAPSCAAAATDRVFSRTV